jgi:hypothetical protein
MPGPSPQRGEGRVRGALSRILIRLIKKLSDMKNLDRRSRGLEPLDDLDDAPGIGGDHRLGTRGPYMRHLALLELPRHLGLG